MSLNFILNCLSFSALSGTYVADLRCSTGKETAECTVSPPILYEAIPVGAVSSTGLCYCYWALIRNESD